MPVGYEDYTGPYEVTPKVESQFLSTADKHMAHDVTIETIHYYEVNNQNRKTIIKVVTKDGALYENYNRGWARGAVAVGHWAAGQDHRRRRRKANTLSKSMFRPKRGRGC